MNRSPDEPGNNGVSDNDDYIDSTAEEVTESTGPDTPDTAVALTRPVPVTPVPISPVAEPVTDYTDGGTPTFDYVRDRIEQRITTSIGSAELAGATPEAAEVEDQFAARQKAGKDRLEAIRRAMREE